MVKNYGIGFCRKVLKDLQVLEDKMFDEKGFGFEKWSEAYRTEMEYKALLKKFLKEREECKEPSYDPSYHGE